MQQSESNGPWREVSRWVEFLIAFGATWQTSEGGSRRIALISMPCDSPGAALLALGAMRRRLSNTDANEIASHFGRIRASARPGAPPTTLRWAQKKRSRFLLDSVDERGLLWAKEVDSSSGLRKIITERQALDWSFDGEPPVQVVPGARLPWQDFYEEFSPRSEAVHAENLGRSDGGVCLAGRATGQAATRRTASSIKFRLGERIADVGQLLSVSGWSENAVSRVSFFNCRTNEVDRSSTPPGIVIADGDISLLKTIDHKVFEGSDVIGVFHRILERDRLEALGQRLTDLRQWYEPDVAAHAEARPPHGIRISVLRRS